MRIRILPLDNKKQENTVSDCYEKKVCRSGVGATYLSLQPSEAGVNDFEVRGNVRASRSKDRSRSGSYNDSCQNFYKFMISRRTSIVGRERQSSQAGQSRKTVQVYIYYDGTSRIVHSFMATSRRSEVTLDWIVSNPRAWL